MAEKADLLEVPSGIPLRRHSSSPPGLLLDNCLSKLSELSERVDKVTQLTRRHSLGDLTVSNKDWEVNLVLTEIIAKAVAKGESNMSTKTKARQCHHCHRPTSHPDHTGVGAGANYCSLGLDCLPRTRIRFR